jgi:hypothetical protein
MAVTSLSPAIREQVTRQLHKLLTSSNLQGSESLCKLLNYLAEQSVQQPGIPIKEFQIAKDVFGRGEDFDPRLDAIVRVQTGRLRTKLTEYYANAGAQDPVLIEMPKGTYALSFTVRGAEPKPELAAPEIPNAPFIVSQPAQAQTPSVPVLPREWRSNAMLVMAALSLVLLAALLFVEMRPRSTIPVDSASSTPYRALWNRFIDAGGEHPLVVYSNAEFVGRPDTGMRYFDPARDSREQILDHYTGVGEVVAVQELTRVFSLMGRVIRVKRGRLLSLDDVKSNNLIFIGSPSENLSLRDLPGLNDFVFQQISEPGQRKGDLAILNVHPHQGERTTFLASGTLPLREDYAVVALSPGLTQSHWILELAGTTTLGTQAAVEYVCRT